MAVIEQTIEERDLHESIYIYILIDNQLKFHDHHLQPLVKQEGFGG